MKKLSINVLWIIDKKSLFDLCTFLIVGGRRKEEVAVEQRGWAFLFEIPN